MQEETSRSKTVSFSQYQIYKTCPHQWYLSHVKKLQPFKPSIYLIFGTALHETLQNYLKVMFEESASKADKIHLPTYFKTRLIELYQQNSKHEHFSTAEELTEFYEDAIAILEFFKSKRSLYFTKKNTTLVGIEVPVSTLVTESIKNVKIRGYVDLITYNKAVDKYTIYDIKTSTRGWTDYEKRDAVKTSQILLYKRLFSQLRDVPEDKIEVQYFIVRRKINENAEYVAKRIQEFVPANGTKKVKDAYEDFKKFVEDVFTPEGEYQEKEYPKHIDNCRFCPYLDRPDLCDRKIS